MTALGTPGYERALDGDETSALEQSDDDGVTWRAIAAYVGPTAWATTQRLAVNHQAKAHAEGKTTRYRSTISRTTHAWVPRPS